MPLTFRESALADSRRASPVQNVQGGVAVDTLRERSKRSSHRFTVGIELSAQGSRVHERDLPAGRQVNRFETEILTILKEPEVLDGRAGEVD